MISSPGTLANTLKSSEKQRLSGGVLLTNPDIHTASKLDRARDDCTRGKQTKSVASKQKWTSGLESPHAPNGKQTRVKRKRPATYVAVSGI